MSLVHQSIYSESDSVELLELKNWRNHAALICSSLRRRARGVARVAVGGKWSCPCPPLTSTLFPWDGRWSICTYYSFTLRWHEMNHTCQSRLARGWRCLFISISGICDTAVDGARSLPRSLLLALATVQLTGEPWMHTQEININKRANWSRLMSFAYVACWESKTKNKLISIMRGAPLHPVWVKPDRTFKIPSRWESSFCGHRVDVHWPAFFSFFFYGGNGLTSAELRHVFLRESA